MLKSQGVRDHPRLLPLDLSRLEQYNSDRLRELILRYERQVESQDRELASLRDEKAQLQDDVQQLEEVAKDWAEINVSLNNRLEGCDDLQAGECSLGSMTTSGGSAEMRAALCAAEASNKALLSANRRKDVELRDLRLRLREATRRKDELEAGLRVAGGAWGQSPAQLARLLETIASLQQENNGLARRLRELRVSQIDAERQVISLTNENRRLTEISAGRSLRASLGPSRGSISFLGRPASTRGESGECGRLRVDQKRVATYEAGQNAQLRDQLESKSKELEAALKKIAMMESRTLFSKPARIDEPKEDSLIINENLNESIAETQPARPQMQKLETLNCFDTVDQGAKEAFRSLHARLKTVYKNFVIVISEKREPRKEDFACIEKQLNDTLESLMVFFD